MFKNIHRNTNRVTCSKILHKGCIVKNISTTSNPNSILIRPIIDSKCRYVNRRTITSNTVKLNDLGKTTQSGFQLDMSKDQVLLRMNELNSMLCQASNHYYNFSEPLLGDDEFDTLYMELESLEAKYPELIQRSSVTQQVGAAIIQENYNKNEIEIESTARQRRPIHHTNPMLSIRTVFEEQSVKDFMKLIIQSNEALKNIVKTHTVTRTSDIDSTEYVASQLHSSINHNEVVVELKFDGLALTAVFNNATLEHVATRGDGTIGENVTSRVIKSAKNFPSQLNTSIIEDTLFSILHRRHITPELKRCITQSLYGVTADNAENAPDICINAHSKHPALLGNIILRFEGVANRSDLTSTNKNRISANIIPFANSRNAIAGTVLSIHEQPKELTPTLSMYCYSLQLQQRQSNENISTSPPIDYANLFIQSLTHTETMEIAKNLGFLQDSHIRPTSIDTRSIYEYISTPKQCISSLLTLTDSISYDENNTTKILTQFYSLNTDVSNITDIAPTNINELSCLYEIISRLYQRLDPSFHDFETDGIVLKANSPYICSFLGTTSRTPRSCIALKSKPMKGITKLQGISLQVGRTGRITPVALLNPVELCGATITRASLHNLDLLTQYPLRGLSIGDYVVIERKGDVIPAVLGRVSSPAFGSEPLIITRATETTEEKNKKDENFELDNNITPSIISSLPKSPENVLLCPCSKQYPLCRGDIVSSLPGASTTSGIPAILTDTYSNSHMVNSSFSNSPSINLSTNTMIYCRNISCEYQWPRRLSHYVSKQSMDVQGLSSKIILILIQEGFLTEELSSIAALHYNPEIRQKLFQRAHQIPGLGLKSIKNIDAAINIAHENATLPQFLHSLGITGLGNSLAHQLSRYFQHNIDTLLQAKAETIAEIPGFGPIKAQNIIQGLQLHKDTTIKSLQHFNVPFLSQNNTLNMTDGEGINMNVQINEEIADTDKVVIPENNLNSSFHEPILVNPFYNLKFCFSGSLSITKKQVLDSITNMSEQRKNKVLIALATTRNDDIILSRDIVTKIIQCLDGNVSNSLTQDTSILFIFKAEAKIGSKIKKAKSLNIPIYDSQQFLEMLQKAE